MAPIVRFAPSPTGRLHVGNIRTAVLNWLFARQAGGAFWLRLDDTDVQRSTEAFADGIRRDLEWLGLSWDPRGAAVGAHRPLRRGGRKAEAAGRLYACYETEDELDRKRKRQLARGLPPIYDRAGLKLSGARSAPTLEAEGRTPHWRFRLANSEDGLTPLPTIVSWNDLIRGDQTVDVGSLSDPVVIRADGTFLYTFTSVVDDAEFGITHVIRGEDHVTNTGVQMQLFEALEAEPPAFGHHSLLIGADGQALSKRLGALSIESLREEGLEPMAVASLHGADRHVGRHRAACEPRRAGAPVRLRQDLDRARAFRSRRAQGAQRQAAAHDALRAASPRGWSSSASAAVRRSGRPCAAISAFSTTPPAGGQVVSGATSPLIEDASSPTGRRAAAATSRGTTRPGTSGSRRSRRPAAARGARCSIRCASR